jgi:hypothetical protein
MTLPEKPPDCIISDSVGSGGVTLSWPIRWLGALRFTAPIFVALFLCLWAMIWKVVTDKQPPGGLPFFSTGLFVGWSYILVYFLWKLKLKFILWPPRPESIRLEADALHYSPGEEPINQLRQRGWRRKAPLPTLAPALDVTRSELGGFFLEHAGRQQHLYLCIELGAKRFEIAPFLSEPDREWLFRVLQSWHSLNAGAFT